jgi:shikimate kinase
MGVGKSAVAKRLSRRVGSRFFDTDVWIVRTAGMPIPEIFARYGEPHFRELETKAARAASLHGNRIVATGGGILGRDENLSWLQCNGVLVALTARPEVILARTAPWDNRPILRTAANPREAVERLLAEREPRYALADWSLDTSDLTVPQVVDQLCEALPSLFPVAATRSRSGPESSAR